MILMAARRSRKSCNYDDKMRKNKSDDSTVRSLQSGDLSSAEGVLQMRTSVRFVQTGFFKFMVCPHGQEGGGKPVRTREGGQFFAILCGRPLIVSVPRCYYMCNMCICLDSPIQRDSVFETDRNFDSLKIGRYVNSNFTMIRGAR